MKNKILSTVKTKRISSYLPFIFILLIAGCIKTEDRCPTYRLPAETQTGQNTVGCLIDGVVMVPNRGGGFFVPETKNFRYNERTGEMFIDIMFYADEKDYECGYPRRLMIFNSQNVFNAGYISPENVSAAIRITQPYQGELKTYHNIFEMTGDLSRLEITKLDTINNVISGKFDFTTFYGIPDNYDSDDKLLITEGRFDFNYRQDGGYIRGFSNED